MIRIQATVDPVAAAAVAASVAPMSAIGGDWQTDWDGQREDLDVGGGGGVAHWVEVVGLNRSGTVTC